MEYTKILELLKKHKVSTYDAMIATSCDGAWKNVEKSGVREKLFTLTYDSFCNVCENIWLDCEEDTGLSTIADKVAKYIIDHEIIPDSYNQVYFDEEEDEDNEDENEDDDEFSVGNTPNIPTEVTIDLETMNDLGINPSETDGDEISDILSDYLSDTYGFCHYGFEFDVENDHINVYNIKWDFSGDDDDDDDDYRNHAGDEEEYDVALEVAQKIRTSKDLSDFYAYVERFGDNITGYNWPESEQDRIDGLVDGINYEPGKFDRENITRIFGEKYDPDD